MFTMCSLAVWTVLFEQCMPWSGILQSSTWSTPCKDQHALKVLMTSKITLALIHLHWYTLHCYTTPQTLMLRVNPRHKVPSTNCLGAWFRLVIMADHFKSLECATLLDYPTIRPTIALIQCYNVLPLWKSSFDYLLMLFDFKMFGLRGVLVLELPFSGQKFLETLKLKLSSWKLGTLETFQTEFPPSLRAAFKKPFQRGRTLKLPLAFH